MAKKVKWKLEKRKLDDICEYIINPRQITHEQGKHLKSSLQKFGQCQPLVINTDNLMIGGHQRLKYLKQLGYKEVEVYVPDRTLEPIEVKELNIRLNKNIGDWDWDMLANAWEAEDLIDWGFSLEDLHISSEPEPEDEEKKPKKYTMAVIFKSLEDMNEAEPKIHRILDNYQGATCKRKEKG